MITPPNNLETHNLGLTLMSPRHSAHCFVLSGVRAQRFLQNVASRHEGPDAGFVSILKAGSVLAVVWSLNPRRQNRRACFVELADTRLHALPDERADRFDYARGGYYFTQPITEVASLSS